MKTIAVLGNNSGRNAGDAAILGCLLNDISERYPDVEFKVPTINPAFVRQAFSKYNVKPVGLLPWNLSAKIYGVPVYRTVLNADLVLVTDAILFDRKLYNPLFNYLWTLSRVLPKAHKRNIPTVLYNSSLGPVPTPAGKKCLKRVVNSADVLMLRDRDSIDLLQDLADQSCQCSIGSGLRTECRTRFRYPL
ncbi:MAG: polysaccharide pyruvyl transferase family protein [candidate division KSB1 bacterium]|nr:polysaccharide pyruvyl transferase family protein [candidate division KSB1 bacterium]